MLIVFHTIFKLKMDTNGNFKFCQDLDIALQKKIRETTNPNCKEVFGRFGPDKCFLPLEFESWMDIINQFAVKENDIWLVSFMKTGTTWIKELIWLLQNNLDFDLAREKNCYIRFPNFENSATARILKSKHSKPRPSSFDLIASDTSCPRLIQTHLPLTLLPNSIQSGAIRPKMIYITRNPKDVAVSYFHHRVLFEGFLGTMDDFVQLFVNDAVRYAPFWNHVQGFWNLKAEPHVLFLTYEQMKKDLSGTVDFVANFLGVTITATEKSELLKYLSFESMKENPSVNHEGLVERFVQMHGVVKPGRFIRKGNVDSWEEELSDEAKQKMEEWCKVNWIPGLQWS